MLSCFLCFFALYFGLSFAGPLLITLLPDGFQGDIAREVLEDHPEIAARLEGFTLYRDPLGMYRLYPSPKGEGFTDSLSGTLKLNDETGSGIAV